MSDGKYNNDNIMEEEQGTMEDFPKEIVQLLMRNHPIKNPEYTKEDRTKRDEARTARRRRLEEEIEQETNEQDMFEEEYSEPLNVEKVEQKRYEEDTEMPFNGDETKSLFDDEEDMVQLIRRVNRPENQRGYRRGFHPENVNEIDDIEKSVFEERKPRPKVKKDNKKPKKREFEERDEEYYEIKKPEDKNRVLDDFFDENDDYYYEEKSFNVKNIAIVLLVVVVIANFALIYNNFTTNARLSEANAKIENHEELQEKNEELKLIILGLEEQLANQVVVEEALPVDEVGEEPEENNGEQGSVEQPPATVATQPETPPTAPQETYDTYTVVEGDSYWIIAHKTLGNGTLYQRILDANQLTENDSIKPGQTLKIPS